MADDSPTKEWVELVKAYITALRNVCEALDATKSKPEDNGHEVPTDLP